MACEVTELDLVVSAVCGLAEDYRTFGNRTAVELVRRSGYLAYRSDVTVDRLAECLATNPAFVRAWFAWSDDTRANARWYLRECGPASFEVGFLDGAGIHSVVAFDDEVRACAEFVDRVVADLAETA
jgi:hypothetical protein